MITLWMTLALAGGPPESQEYRPATDCTSNADTELVALRDADQADRRADMTPDVMERDAERLARVLALVEAGKVCSPTGHHAAALVLQHSRTPEHHRIAHQLSRFAADNGDPSARWLAAASWDRWHVSRGLPQFFGTQMVKNAPTDPWCLVTLDATSTPEAREAWGVKPMVERYARLLQMNGKADLEATEAVVTELGYLCPAKAWE